MIRNMIRGYAAHDTGFDKEEFLDFVRTDVQVLELSKEEAAALKKAAADFIE